MYLDPARERFCSMLALDDADVDLLAAGFLIAQEERPQLSISREIGAIRAIGKRLGGIVGPRTPWYHSLHALNTIFFADEGFYGDRVVFDDPNAAHLDWVMEVRTGLPIALSILYIEIGRCAGLRLSGVAFPGHFLVRMESGGGPLFIDVFHGGRLLIQPELQSLLHRLRGRHSTLLPSHLAPAGNKRIILRLLANLKRAYLQKRDLERALMAVERMVCVDPDRVVERRDRGLLYGQTGQREAAIMDLRDYLDARPDAHDAERIRRVLVGLLAERAAEA